MKKTFALFLAVLFFSTPCFAKRDGYYDVLQAPNDVDKTLPSDGYVLAWNAATGLWTPVAQTGGSGSGTPGGSTTQLQYNSAGSFAGASGLVTNGTKLGIGHAVDTNAIVRAEATSAVVGSSALLNHSSAESRFYNYWAPSAFGNDSSAFTLEGEYYNSLNTSSSIRHAGGVFGSYSDTASGALLLGIGTEGFSLGYGSSTYVGTVGHALYRNDTAVSAPIVAAFMSSIDITKLDGTTGLASGTEIAYYAPAINGGSTVYSFFGSDPLKTTNPIYAYGTSNTHYSGIYDDNTNAYWATDSGSLLMTPSAGGGILMSQGLFFAPLTSNSMSIGASTFEFSDAWLKGNLYLNSGDLADTGRIRMSNADLIGWEANPTGTDLTLGMDANNVLTSSVPINATTGFRIGNAAASGKFLVGNGTNYVASTSTVPTSAGATANKVLLSDGTNYVLSTPTFPNASATSGKTIRSDGTNWIASTATLSDAPSTAGKALVSDGTNWITSTPTFPNASATSGKFIRSDGTNWIASTPTLPTSAGTAGKVLRSDATNYIESTPTFANTATSAHVLRGDGTNWLDAALSLTDLNTFSSANLATQLTDETGTGVSVFGTAPTFTTSIKMATDLGTVLDANANTLLRLDAVTSAVNYIDLADAATATNPTLTANGSDSNVGVNFTAKGSGGFVFTSTGTGMWATPPAAETISAAATITADGCGTIKSITASGAVTTNTTNTFTAPAAGNAGCCMMVVNTGSNNITLDNNANFKSAGAADVVMTADDSVIVCSTGASGKWYQISALEAN